MIRSFRHKGLRRLSANKVFDMDLAGYRLHPLKGELKGFHPVTVQANWRVIFRLADGEVTDVNYLDYHYETIMRMKNPPHPGTLVLNDCIQPLGLTITQAAAALRVTRDSSRCSVISASAAAVSRSLMLGSRTKRIGSVARTM